MHRSVYDREYGGLLCGCALKTARQVPQVYRPRLPLVHWHCRADKLAAAQQVAAEDATAGYCSRT